MEGEMINGHLDMIVLAALSAGPAHGYAVIEEIRRRSGQAFDLPEGTIYPALHRLEQAGLLSSRWVVAESGRQRRVYTLTRRDERALTERRAVWRQFCEAMGGLLTSAPRRGRPA
jgi:PadR family transcriptional regulator, regulatory protein PadR